MTGPVLAAPRCIGEPVSWIRLERYHLGEIAGAEREGIAKHLAACAACAASMSRILEEESRALPALELGSPRVRVARVFRMPSPRVMARVTAAAAALAVAAVVVLGIGRGWRGGSEPGTSPMASRAKGGSLAFTLVRDDDERIAEDEGVFRDGDRWKALVTCAPGTAAVFDLVIFDATGPSYPLGSAQGLTCGNDVPLRGAFRLTGDTEETICLVWREDGSVERPQARSVEDLGEHALCKRLRPAR